MGTSAWADFARSKGKSFAWRVGHGREGDNPTYIQQMHDFLERNAGTIAHEAYFNTSKYQLYPVGPNPKSAPSTSNCSRPLGPRRAVPTRRGRATASMS